MARIYSLERRDRIGSALGVAAIHALIGYALIRGLGVDVSAAVPEALKVIDVTVEPPPEPPAEPERPKARERKARAKNPEGAASPKNLRDTPSPVVAPKPIVPLPVPSPVIAAPVPAEGNRASAGAADVPGPGTGSGGQGTGRGSGDSGDGTGGGGGGGAARRAEQIAGRIYDSDYPRSALRARVQGTVHLRFIVSPQGRVSECAVLRSSGNAALDETTCRLIKKRYRFDPARDEEGRATTDRFRGDHIWELGPEPPPIDVEPTIPDEG